MTATGQPSRRSRGGSGLEWLRQEGGGDAATVMREQLQALVGPARDGERVEEVSCEVIDPSPFQARRVFPRAAMEALRESVRTNGLLQPVVLRPGRSTGRFELVAGERRWRVVAMLGWPTIPALVREVDDLAAHVLGQVENDARLDVSAWERALGYVALRDHVTRARGGVPSLAQLAELRGGVDRSTVSRYLTVGEALHPSAVAEAGLTDDDMASLSLPILLRAARLDLARGIAFVQDALRKRKATSGERPASAHITVVADPTNQAGDRGPDVPSMSGWRRYFEERSIRVETSTPAKELSPRQARAAGTRIVPALAALAARAADGEVPAPLEIRGDGGRVIFLPERLDGAQTVALKSLLSALGL